jgi:hypothetical protein
LEKKGTHKKTKFKQTNTRAQRKHGQHIQNQGPKQTTRNAGMPPPTKIFVNEKKR